MRARPKVTEVGKEASEAALEGQIVEGHVDPSNQLVISVQHDVNDPNTIVLVCLSHSCLWSLPKAAVYKSWGLFYKLLWIHNIRQTDRFRSKRVSCILLGTNTIAYFEIFTLWTRNFFIVQAPYQWGLYHKTFTVVINYVGW